MHFCAVWVILRFLDYLHFCFGTFGAFLNFCFFACLRFRTCACEALLDLCILGLCAFGGLWDSFFAFAHFHFRTFVRLHFALLGVLRTFAVLVVLMHFWGSSALLQFCTLCCRTLFDFCTCGTLLIKCAFALLRLFFLTHLRFGTSRATLNLCAFALLDFCAFALRVSFCIFSFTFGAFALLGAVGDAWQVLPGQDVCWWGLASPPQHLKVPK